MEEHFPKTLQQINAWAKANDRPANEARDRFAQYVVLWALAGSLDLGSKIVFKGGNALDFIWHHARSTTDLDFSADMTLYDSGTTLSDLQAMIAQALVPASRTFEIALRIQRFRQQPPGKGRTFITYVGNIGYALHSDRRNVSLIESNRPSPLVVPIDISLNEPICGDQIVALGHNRTLRVSTREDIVAEKLRALLQQQAQLRGRNRPQDLLDIAVIQAQDAPLDLALVSTFLKTKAAARNVPVSREAFYRPEIAERAEQGYEALVLTTRSGFIPFAEALKLVLDLVDELDIPPTENV